MHRQLKEQTRKQILIEKNTSIIFKGICAIFILVYHILSKGLEIDNANISQMLFRLRGIGMMGFLLISGYGLYMSYIFNGLDRYWDKKVNKLLVPVLMGNLLGAFVHFFFGGGGEKFVRNEFYEKMVLRDVSATSYNRELWYIKMLVAWYAIFYMVFRLVKNKSRQLLVFLIASGIMVYFIPEVYGMANAYSLAFPMGVFIAWYLQKTEFSERLIKFLKIVLIPCALLSFVLLVWMNDEKMVIAGLNIYFWIWICIINFLHLICVFAVLSFSNMISGSRVKGQFIWLGEVSLLIYVFQRPLILDWLELFSSQSIRWLYGMMGLVVLFVICWIYSRKRH